MSGPLDTGRSPWTRPGFLVSAGVLVAVVIGLVVVLVSTSGGDGEPESRPTAGGSPVATTGGPLPTVVPTVGPTDVSWRLLGQIPLPYSRSAGPFRIADHTAAGFAHTPDGALVATLHLVFRAGASAGASSYEPTIRDQYLPSADRDALLASLRAGPQEPAAPGELAQPFGYLYQSYSPDTAVVGIVLRVPSDQSDPTYAVLNATVQWRDADWRMVAPPSGSWVAATRPAYDLTGVVVWSPH